MQQYLQQERPVRKGWQVAKFIKRVLVIAIVGAIAAAVIYASVLPSTQKQAAGGRRAKMGNGPVPVLVAPARIADVPLYLDGVGTAKARNTVTVRPQVDGRILSINFKEGQEVKRGDVLAKIDPSTYQAQLDQAAAKKALDESQLANAERDMERYTKLGGNIIAQKTIDTQRALVDQLTAQIKLDDAAIANAKAFLDYTTILAPIDGRTGIRMVDEGNLVRASDAGIVVITEIRPISVLFTLPQQQLAQVNKAQAAGALAVEALDADGRTDARPRYAAGGRQPGRSDDRHGADEGGVSQRQSAAMARPVRQRAPADRHAEAGGGRADARRAARPQRHLRLRRAEGGDEDRVSLRPVTVAHQTETDARHRQGPRQLRARGDHRLRPPEGRRRASPSQRPRSRRPLPTATGSRLTAAAKEEARASFRAACAADIQKFCPDAERGKGMRACLQTNAAATFRRLQGGRRKQVPQRQVAQGGRQLDRMSVSGPFIKRPIATTLLAFAVMLGGWLGYWWLPVSSLPQVDFPTIQVTTQLPGANPETMANLVTAPLERQLGQISALTSMTSSSSFGISQITLQFALDRDIDAAAQDVQAAINAAGSTLPRNLPYPPTYAKLNPADTPIITLALTSDTIPLRTLSDLADTLMAQRLASVTGVGHVAVQGGIKPAVRIQADLSRLSNYGLSMADLRTAIAAANVSGPKGSLDGRYQSYAISANDQITNAEAYKDGHRRLPQQRARAAQGRRPGRRRPGEHQGRRLVPGRAGRRRRRIPPARRQRHRDRPARQSRTAAHRALDPERHQARRSCTTAPAPSAPPFATCSSRSASASCWWCWWC